jgi:hypothetical protein
VLDEVLLRGRATHALLWSAEQHQPVGKAHSFCLFKIFSVPLAQA